MFADPLQVLRNRLDCGGLLAHPIHGMQLCDDHIAADALHHAVYDVTNAPTIPEYDDTHQCASIVLFDLITHLVSCSPIGAGNVSNQDVQDQWGPLAQLCKFFD